MNFFTAKLIAAATLVTCAFGNASATTIDFDHADAMGIAGWVNQVNVPINTQGFLFSSNMDVIDVTNGIWNTGPAHSGSFATLNDWGGDVTMTAANKAVFSLQDFWIHGWFGDTSGGTVTGYLNGVAVGSVAFATGSTWIDVVTNFTQVDSIVVKAGVFLVDDITVNAKSANVPEPASLALFGLGLAGLAGIARRKKA